MKKRQTDQRPSRQAEAGFNKKYPKFGILVLCLLLGCGIAVSLAFLGVSLGRFLGTEAYEIPLTPPKEVHVETKEEKKAAAASGEASSRQTFGNTSYTAGQPGQKHGDVQVYDDAQIWNSETHVDLFKSRYDGTVESDNGEKVIAPGTSSFYDFTLKNNSKIPLDYEISLEVTPYSETEDAVIPLEWRLLTADGTTVSDWREHTERIDVLRQATLDIRHQDRYEIEWRWAFEQDESMDEMDTKVGNLAVEQPLGVTATIYVRAEQSANLDGTLKNHGATPKTGDHANLLLYAALLTASACGLLILFAVAKRRKKNGDGMHGRQKA